jgi:hypothetical protein
MSCIRQHTSAYVSACTADLSQLRLAALPHVVRARGSVSIRQHTSAYVSACIADLSQLRLAALPHVVRVRGSVSIRQHTSAYVSACTSVSLDSPRCRMSCVRACTAADNEASVWLTCLRFSQHTSAYVSIRQHTSAYVSIRQHKSAYVSIRARMRRRRQ